MRNSRSMVNLAEDKRLYDRLTRTLSKQDERISELEKREQERIEAHLECERRCSVLAGRVESLEQVIEMLKLNGNGS